MAKSKTRYYALQCAKCNDVILSRARHDFRMCGCGETFVDGGFDYCRFGGSIKSEPVSVRLAASKVDLYNDWNSGKDKFGLWTKEQYEVLNGKSNRSRKTTAKPKQVRSVRKTTKSRSVRRNVRTVA